MDYTDLNVAQSEMDEAKKIIVELINMCNGEAVFGVSWGNVIKALTEAQTAISKLKTEANAAKSNFMAKDNV